MPDFLNAYRQKMVTGAIYGPLPERVPMIASLLRSLLGDIDAGLVATLSTAIRAETFNDFLDHAVAYQDRSHKDQAGVIAGVVFEDTMRRICAKSIGQPTNKPLEDVINELTGKGITTEEQKKRMQTAAFIRTKATHANWTRSQRTALTIRSRSQRR